MSLEKVFLLWHTDRFENEILIGVYRTKEDAKGAIDRVKDKPGFSEEVGEFETAEYELNKDHWTKGFIRPED
jgi:hypothetical protein